MRRAGTTGASGALHPRALAAYGLLGMPLAMAALPLYVHLPKFYADHLGVSLTALGVLLLVLRLADGVLDPLLGAWSDRASSRKRLIAIAMPLLALGIVALFLPPQRDETALLVWLGLSLALVYAAFSLATINHNAWGAELSTDPVERTRITATRESLALVGVVVASVLPGLLGGAGGEAVGLPRFAIGFCLLALICTAVTLVAAPAATRVAAVPASLWRGITAPLTDPNFRRLLLVFVANGIASAIPATLVLFFIADLLQAEGKQGLFLALYFIAGAAGMPLWVRLSARVGKVRAWGIAMVVAIAAFVWAAFLGAGDHAAFAVICALSGIALGADLALPPSLLADVIDGNSERNTNRHIDGNHEIEAESRRPLATGAYFGLWTLATKLNLALAAGVALPLLGALGYAPGARDAQALGALAMVYAAVPCALKLVAVGTLVHFSRNWKESLR